MTQNRRIVLNVMATYGRTLFSIACGIFSVRWVLQALGHEDFGLFGVVGSLAIFMNFLNIQLSGALSRFFAVSQGRMKVAADRGAGLRECQEWFSCGVFIHTVIPLLLVLIGLPVGTYAIQSGWLTIPEGKVDVCVWLWRFVCVSSFVGMVNTPFSAMYIAKQYIAELTIYSFLQTIIRTGFVYVMTLIQIDWLWGYGLAMCAVAIVPQILICCRAFSVFPECRIVRAAMMDWRRVRQIAAFAGWQSFGGIGYLARHQCLEIVVNKYFGPKTNAAYTVASTFGAEAASLTGALNGAFAPVVSTAYGAGKKDYMIKMAMRSCKFGTLLTLMFAIPMFIEADEILKLWLKTPPTQSTGLCMIMLGVVVIEKLTIGHGMVMDALGKVGLFRFARGLSCLTAIPFSIVFLRFYNVVYAVAAALLVTTVIVAVSDVLIARICAQVSSRSWFFGVVFPIFIVSVIGFAVGILPTMLLRQSFVRICITTAIFLMVFLPCAAFIVLSRDERSVVAGKLAMLLKRRKG